MILFDFHGNTIKGTIIPNILQVMKQTQWAYIVSTGPNSRPSLGASRASAPKDTWHRDREMGLFLGDVMWKMRALGEKSESENVSLGSNTHSWTRSPVLLSVQQTSFFGWPNFWIVLNAKWDKHTPGVRNYKSYWNTKNYNFNIIKRYINILVS